MTEMIPRQYLPHVILPLLINFVQLESIIVAKNLVRRYIWLIDTIRSCPKGITFEEINQAWERSVLNDDGTPLPKRTFHAHIDAILDEFGIEITCDRSDGYRYRIEDEISEYGSIRATLIDSLVLGNAVAEMPAMKERVLIGRHVSNPWVATIIKAIRQSHIIKVYQILSCELLREKNPEKAHLFPDIEKTFILEPYGIVLYDEWFLVGRAPIDGFTHIILVQDIVNIEDLEDTFVFPEDFDLKYYCENYDVEKISESGEFFKHAFLDDGASLQGSRDNDIMS